MRLVIQRSGPANVKVENKVVGEIEKGLVVLVGIEGNDTEDDVDWLVNKISKLRIFSDQDGKMNLSIQDIEGQLLIISQFTLHAAVKKGTRPSFVKAAHPDQAIPLYQLFIKKSQAAGIPTASGNFGADMQVSLVNDGPVTILIDSKNKE